MINRAYSFGIQYFRILVCLSVTSIIITIIWTLYGKPIMYYNWIGIQTEKSLTNLSNRISLETENFEKLPTEATSRESTELSMKSSYHTSVEPTYQVPMEPAYQNETKACSVPKLDPWDPSIISFVKHPQLFCSIVQPFMTYIDEAGYLLLNKTEVDSMIKKNKNFQCFYQTFDRKDGIDDNDIEYDERKELQMKPVKLTRYNVDVKCYENDRKIYWNIHAHPIKIDKILYSKPTEDQLSVYFFLIDSVAASVLKRNLPLTYNYTKNVMGIKYFNAYNKIGDNSFPNIIPMFIGKRVRDEQEDMLKEIEATNETYFDDWPLLWKSFKNKGYITVFDEDMPRFGLFHYMLKGFKKKAFDYNYHQFWHVLTPAKVYGQGSYCFGNTHRAQIMLDLFKRHVTTMSDKLQFIYSAIGELPHDVENEIEQIDFALKDMWQELYTGGFLNKSVVFFLSDHGIRYGKIRTTTTGALEEQLPMFGLWFPDWFYKKYPHLKDNIEENSDILSTCFDVYETLNDILNSNFRGSQRSITSRAQSQMYPLPKNRTCKSAGIADRFCTCLQTITEKPNPEKALKAATALINRLNDLLQNFTDICHKIEISQIIFANELGFNNQLDKSNLTVSENGRKLLISIETLPNNATFEAMLKMNNNDAWIVEGEISRTSKYSGLSDCIKDKYLRRYCSCKIL